MSKISTATVKSITKALGVQASPDNVEAAARFATTVLEGSAKPFSALAFEDEPSGHAAALRGEAK